MHIAAATDNADLCRLLFDRGAEVNPVARSSKNDPLTPLDCATSRGHRSTAKYLQMHGGLPASKLANTQIVIDGAPITALPTRRVTSTKIDVRDRIRIEKREIVELSSPVQERRRVRDRTDSDSTSSSVNGRKTRKRSENKYSDRHYDRRKKLIEPQKSFSDGYDTELDEYSRDQSHEKKYRKGSKKSRSRSEPSRRSKSSARHHRRYRSDSESSSETESYSEKKKSKRHRKRSKKKASSQSESSSTESSERRNTKRKGKKTSIHIENDDKKQSVNIVKYKGTESVQKAVEINENMTTNTEGALAEVKTETDKEDAPLVKSKTLSETETDTLSVKTNMIVTEAQIHMERESSQQGSSEITVTVDASNNVSIETANLSVTHKDSTEEQKNDSEKLEIQEPAKEIIDNYNSVDQGTENALVVSNEVEESVKKVETTETTVNVNEVNAESQEEQIHKSQSKELEKSIQSEDASKDSLKSSKESELNGSSTVPEHETKNIDSSSSTLERTRKRSFQILSGPDETLGEGKDVKEVSSENKESQDKTSSPSVSFANKDEIFESKDSDKQSNHLMGEEVIHSELPEPDGQITNNLQKESSVTSVSAEEKRKDYTSTTGSSTEITQSVDKGLVSVIDENISESDRAVQQVIMENVSEDYDINLPLSQASPKHIRKTSKDSLVSSRKSSIYETESYKVLSDIASVPEICSPGILKKPSQLDEGSLEDDKEAFDETRLVKDNSYGRVPSVSDNEIYSHSEVNGRRKRFRKKGRTKSRTTIRSKSENSERGYESSGLMDSGFEPSPRAVQRRIMSPRLAAYYEQRNASGRYSGKSDSRIPVRKPGDKNAVDMKSVTQRIQTNMRR